MSGIDEFHARMDEIVVTERALLRANQAWSLIVDIECCRNEVEFVGCFDAIRALHAKLRARLAKLNAECDQRFFPLSSMKGVQDGQ